MLHGEEIDPAAMRLISLATARDITGLDLVSARDVRSAEGRSFHELEAQSESNSHRAARNAAIGFFRSVGYEIYPEGVGIRDVYTLADFLAIRKGRSVFVEVLSDDNVTAETLRRKAKLQEHGELCFVVYSGTKRAVEPGCLAGKRDIESWADVLYCSLNRWTGVAIRPTFSASVAYDTTRTRGIRVALAFEPSKRKLAVAVRFITHLYRNSLNTPLSYVVLPPSYCYERVFLDVFKKIARKRKLEAKLRRGRQHVTAFRAMRRKSGLKMIDSQGQVILCLKSEYRGKEAIDTRLGNYHPPSRDLPPNDVYGVFVLERYGPDGLRDLIDELEAYGFILEYDPTDLQRARDLLTTQVH